MRNLKATNIKPAKQPGRASPWFVSKDARLNHSRLVVNVATIYSDSQVAVACVKGEATGAPKSLLRAIRSEMKCIEGREDCLLLSLLWCPGHRDVLGSLEADSEAKAAARGKTYPPEFVPKLLVKYRPVITRHTAKTVLKETNREYALRNWESSRQGVKLRDRFPFVEPSFFLPTVDRLSRPHATLLFRLISGRIQLQRHLHSIHAVDSPICEGCGDAPETVAHFILRCPKYARPRQDILASKGRDYLSLLFLFFNKIAFPSLFHFIRSTGRFRDHLR